MCFRGKDCIRLCRDEFEGEDGEGNCNEGEGNEGEGNEGEGGTTGYGNDLKYIDIGTERWTMLRSL